MHDETSSPAATLRTILDRENLFILAADPAALLGSFGGLIAAACARGRPPVVAVLGDGCPAGAPDEAARRLEREARAGLEAIGVPEEFALFAGFRAGAAPLTGAAFDRAVRNLGLTFWRRDGARVVAAAEPAEGGARVMATALRREFGVGGLWRVPRGGPGVLSLGGREHYRAEA